MLKVGAALTYEQQVAGQTVTGRGHVWERGPDVRTYWVTPAEGPRCYLLVRVPTETDALKGKVAQVLEVRRSGGQT